MMYTPESHTYKEKRKAEHNLKSIFAYSNIDDVMVLDKLHMCKCEVMIIEWRINDLLNYGRVYVI